MLGKRIELGRLCDKDFPEQVAFCVSWYSQLFRKSQPAFELANQVQTKPMDRSEVCLLQRAQIDESFCFWYRVQQPLARTALKSKCCAIRIRDDNQPPQSSCIPNGEFANSFDNRSGFAGSGASDYTKIAF